MKTILLQQANGLYTKLLDITEARHQAYAANFDITYCAVRGSLQFQRSPLWNKIPLIRQALALKFDLVVWLDADTLIRRTDVDLRLALGEGSPIGMCRHPTPWDDQDWHFNSGVIFIRHTKLTRKFFDRVWKAGPVNHPWHEQVRINQMSRAGVSPHYLHKLAAGRRDHGVSIVRTDTGLTPGEGRKLEPPLFIRGCSRHSRQPQPAAFFNLNPLRVC